MQYAPEASTSPEGASLRKPADYERLVRTVEWKLIEMPLPRLQTIGNTGDRFIYEIGWDTTVRRKDISFYQNGRDTCFDNNIRFKPLVGDYFLQLNHLLRPLIYRKWTSLVAQFNKLPDSELESFLFERLRISTAPIREPLWEMQKRRCFYCEGPIRRPDAADVDHFLPWSRFPDNGIENLVVADRLCNQYKKDFLAGTSHLVRWRTRFDATSPDGPQVMLLAELTGWDSHPDKTFSAARAIYLRLPTDALLWHRLREFVTPDAGQMQSVFG
jgi:HNH endonuclease